MAQGRVLQPGQIREDGLLSVFPTKDHEHFRDTAVDIGAEPLVIPEGSFYEKAGLQISVDLKIGHRAVGQRSPAMDIGISDRGLRNETVTF